MEKNQTRKHRSSTERNSGPRDHSSIRSGENKNRFSIDRNDRPRSKNSMESTEKSKDKTYAGKNEIPQKSSSAKRKKAPRNGISSQSRDSARSQSSTERSYTLKKQSSYISSGGGGKFKNKVSTDGNDWLVSRTSKERNENSRDKPSARTEALQKGGLAKRGGSSRNGISSQSRDSARSQSSTERSRILKNRMMIEKDVNPKDKAFIDKRIKPRSSTDSAFANRNRQTGIRFSAARDNSFLDDFSLGKGEKRKVQPTQFTTGKKNRSKDAPKKWSPQKEEARTNRPVIEKHEKVKGRSHYGWMWGVHAVEAALKTGRHVYELYYLPQKAEQFRSFGGECVSVQQLEQYVPKGAVHQGVVLCAGPAPTVTLDVLVPDKGTVLILDQIVDPHNLGALWRSAAAFGAQAVVLPEDRSSPLCGVAAKAASGALEYVPCVRVTNLSRALAQLKKQGFFVVGLDESGQELVPRTAFSHVGIALVVGREDKGMRPLTQSHCDVIWKLSVSPQFPTLNASVAGAVALSQVYVK